MNMTIDEAIRNRRSVRTYRSEKVSEEIINQIIEAGLWAPSGMGRQSPVILSVSDEKTVREISALNARVMNSDADPFYGAPQVLVVLADRNVPTYVYDGALVMQNMMLKAYELGVSSCWIHRAKQVFDSEEGKAILKKAGIEGDYEGIGNLIIGWCDGEIPQAKPRKEGRVFRI